MVKKKNIVKIKAVIFTLLICFFSISFLVIIPSLLVHAQKKVFLFQPKFESSGGQGSIVNIQKAPVLKVINLGQDPPKFSAEAVLVKDLDTGALLYQKNINAKMSPASTTKIVTALVALDYYKPDDLLVVGSTDLVGGSTMGLSTGEKLTFRSLLYGMLLNSGNDAAYTIASNYPGGLNMFIMHMNKKVHQLGLYDSHFENPAGFDSPNHYSSAADLAKIATVVVANSELKRVVATKETSVTSWDNSKTHYLKNLNKLLGEDGVLGVKTGFTEAAGENLVGLMQKNGHKILTVVLNSKNRFAETKSLFDWTFSNFQWKFETS